MKILDHVGKEQLVAMQEYFSKACGVIVLIEDASGKPVIKASGTMDDDCTKANENILVENDRVGRVTVAVPSSDGRSDEALQAAASYLAYSVKDAIVSGKLKELEKAFIEVIRPEIEAASVSVNDITGRARKLEEIASKQNILTLNASIEAARAGTAGAGFAVVAHQMGEMSKNSGVIYGDIEKDAHELKAIIGRIGEVLKEENQEQA